MKRAVVSASAVASQVTAEGVVLVLPFLQVPEEPGNVLWSHVLVDAYINFTPGTAATQLTIRIRRGTTISGALVGPALVLPVTAGSPGSYTIMADDLVVQATPPLVPGQQYAVTVQQSAGPATAAGTSNYAVAHTTAS